MDYGKSMTSCSSRNLTLRIIGISILIVFQATNWVHLLIVVEIEESKSD
jgi:hypothetical protein